MNPDSAASTAAHAQGREDGQYEAWAQARQEDGWRGLGFGYGTTPVAALLALAARLSEAPR